MASAQESAQSLRWWLLALGMAAVVASSLPVLPVGPNVHVHFLWTQQVMRCLGEGVLPLWFPDLNGGLGSPGLRLYSPLGPFLAGAFGLCLAGRGGA